LAQQDTDGITCRGINDLGHCPEGKIPTLTPGNRNFWRLFALMLPGLIHKDGYDYNAITTVFDACGTSGHCREIYIEQCAAVIDVIHKIRTADRA
jgi:hypothetical protein